MQPADGERDGPGTDPGLAGVAPIAEVKNLRVRYRNGALGVTDVSLMVYPSQVVALFGPNGAGKTTTVRALSGFMKTEGARVVGGSVRFAGRDIRNHEPYRVNKMGISLVPERGKVFTNLSVAENLAAIGGKPRRAKKELHDEVYTLFPVLAERRRLMAGRLSGGQQQMLAIARALLSEPRLLIIDEMTLGLHQSLHQMLFDAVRKIATGGRSVLISDESIASSLEIADHCLLLNAGRLRASGPRSDFVGSELLIAGYVEA